jgi:hypothetical protein
MLVAGNSTASNKTASSTVAIIAARRTAIIVLMQQGALPPQHLNDVAVRRTVPRYTTAIPKTVHKNAGVTVIAAVILRKAVMMPTTRLIISATVVQEFLHEQSDVDIVFTSVFIIWIFSRKVKTERGAQAKSEGFCSDRRITAPEPPGACFQHKLKDDFEEPSQIQKFFLC